MYDAFSGTNASTEILKMWDTPKKPDEVIDAIFEPIEEKVQKTQEFIVETKATSKAGAKKVLSESATVLTVLAKLATGDPDTFGIVAKDLARQFLRK